MEHGQYGAEILAVVMRAVFTPLIHSVFEQNGFITGFAGDAFTAVFPKEANQALPQIRALAAARQIQQHMADNIHQETRFGLFEFSAKIGLALGESTWGIISSEDGQQATYFFSGSAIDGCAQAETYGFAGEIVAGDTFYEAVREWSAAEQVQDYWRIKHIEGPLPTPDLVGKPPVNIDLASRFVPRILLEREIEGEFRQILNLFIGLQGTPTREELNTFMQDLFRLQNRYGGFLNRIDFGDKGCHLLLFWGAPLSHEYDLAHVLDFILALEGGSKIQLRAGITYRIAHAGMIGSELAEEYTCYGRGVNLAARFMTSAGWGEIWLDGETAQRASAEFEVRSIGAKTLKGFAEEQEVYRLQGRRIKYGSRFEDKPLVGRQQELEGLREAIQPIFNGRFGGSAAVIGEAGVGKSRLVDALYASYLEQEQAAVFFCQADELLRQSLNPFRYFLLRYFNHTPMDDDDANKQHFEQKFEDLLEATIDPVLREELLRARSFLGHLIGLSWTDSLYEQLDPELRFENTLSGLKAFFKAESLRRPLILHLEDAHWWDSDSQTFLNRLTRNVANNPFVLVITSREELLEGLFEPAVPQVEIQLLPLGQESVAELAEDIVGHLPSPALVNLLQERTQGNPFFVEQILLYLQAHGLLEKVEADSARTLPGDPSIPTDVRAVLTARLDRLPFDIK
ncbi:MAG: AAA family ATPase, partial [Candidatus Promineifilaceae bacterium]